MNTRLDISLPGLDEDLGDYLLDLIRREVERTEQKLSIYNPDSEISHINQTAFENTVKIDDELLYIFSHCLMYHQQTGGAFDITMRPLLDFWRTHDPEPENIILAKNLRQKLGSDKIVLNRKKKTIRFASSEIGVDLGGFAKGYALLRVKHILKDHNIGSAFVSFGESTILGVGDHPYGQGWKAGVSDFFDFNANLYTFNLRDQALSVSGNSRNILMRKEKLKGHIINPIEARPVEGLSAVAVVSFSVLDAEVLSTALFSASDGQKKDILIKFPSSKAIVIRYDDQKQVHIREII